jgi:nucleotide-binding universal stress UspA family protein
MAKIKTILAPTDLSDLSAKGVAYACSLAKDLEAHVIIFNVVKVEELMSLLREMKDAPSPRWDDGLEEKLIQHHKRLLDEFAKQQLPRLIADKNIRRVVKLGEPYKMIVDCAEEEKVDLIVMSTHGRSGLPRLMLGSVTEKVLRSSSRPVLAMPPHEI